MSEESFEFHGKRACSFLGCSRYTIRRYRRRGLLPNRTRFSEAELRACLEKLTPRARPGAAEGLNMARAKKTPVVDASTTKPEEGQATAPPPAVAEPEKKEAPSPAPPAKAALPIPEKCDGPADPHHVEFPAGKPWPEVKARREAAEKAGKPLTKEEREREEDMNVFGDWDCAQ